MALYRILSLDGGGIKGLLTAIIIERLNKEFPNFFKKADLISGVSTGGIITIGLAYGLTPEQLRNLYENQGPKIFSNSILHKILCLKKVFGANYTNKFLKKNLQEFFGEDKLKDLKQKVLLTSYALYNENPDPYKRYAKPKFYHNFPEKNCTDCETLLWKLGIYTSAAPTYFPSFEGFIDGGLVSMNPSVSAIAQARDERSTNNPPDLNDIVMLSIGTGKASFYIKGKNLDWGFFQWAKPSLRVWIDGITDVSHFQSSKILGKNYCRIDPPYSPSEDIEMDAVNKIPQIIETAENADLRSTIEWIKNYWM